jgi:hypothetical protein
MAASIGVDGIPNKKSYTPGDAAATSPYSAGAHRGGRSFDTGEG